jgi:tRNA modification GTPase
MNSMPPLPYHPDDCICALATPLAESALAVIRLSGPETVAKLVPLFSGLKGLSDMEGHTIRYGRLADPATGRILDEVTLAVYRAPRSYTGQESAEITCHGSLPVIREILDLFTVSGFRPASPGEFTFRAYVNGKLDLTRAEAVQELITARSGTAGTLALDRLFGSVAREVLRYRGEILRFAAWVELHLDYPEEEIEPPPFNLEDLKSVMDGLSALLGTYRVGKLFRDGIKLVLAGRTNAGKSSLFNLLLCEERSIVSDLHGTTRDYLECPVSLAGIPVTLYDTAGLRQTDSRIEEEGIRRSRRLIDEGDLILYLADGETGLLPEDTEFYDCHENDRRFLFVWNKGDSPRCQKKPDGWIMISALTGEGFASFEQEISSRIFSGRSLPSDGRAVIDSDRQRHLLSVALEGLGHFRDGFTAGQPMDILAEDLQQTLTALGELTGEITPEDILDTLFSSFCVGK